MSEDRAPTELPPEAEHGSTADPSRPVDPERAALEAACVHAGAVPGLAMATPPLAPPIFAASVFEVPSLAQMDGVFAGEPGLYAYSRSGNPTVAALEGALAALEGAEAAVAAASGMGAISAALLTLLRPGDTVVTTTALYGHTRGLLDERLAALGLRVRHMDEAAILAGLPEGCRLVYTESISNPLLAVADLPRLAEAAHAAGALLLVDATFATPFHQQPLALGADLVLHSATKYLGGHGDLILGLAAGRAELVDRVRATLSVLGATPGPFEAWLALRGLRTLHLRMARQSANAAAVADWLAAHPAVAAVHYPGHAGHPSHGAAARVLRRGFGGMLAFDLGAAGAAEGRAAVDRLLGGLGMIVLAPSLGDIGSTLSYPATTSHRQLDAAEQAAQGITPGLVRLSCGIEAPETIIADLAAGLAAVQALGTLADPR